MIQASAASPASSTVWRAVVSVPWALAASWALLIFLLSTEALSGERLAHWLVDLFVPAASSRDTSGLLEIGSSIVHVVEYFVLVVLVAHALRSGGLTATRAALCAFVLAILYAAGDEMHQAFVPERTAAVTDWALDLFGAGMAALWLAAPHRAARERRSR